MRSLGYIANKLTFTRFENVVGKLMLPRPLGPKGRDGLLVPPGIA